MIPLLPRLFRVSLALVLVWIGSWCFAAHERPMQPPPAGWRQAALSWRILAAGVVSVALISTPGRLLWLIVVGRDPPDVWPPAPTWARLRIAALAGVVAGKLVNLVAR